MDYLSHGLWSYIFFHRTKFPFHAILFGMLPDTLSWAIYFIYQIIFLGGFGPPVIEQIPKWVFFLYGLSHSLVISTIAVIVTYFILGRLFLPMLAWPIAIIMDLLTHTKEFLPTPFLWPISNYAFDGISWGTKWFMILNWGLILTCIITIKLWKTKQNKKYEQV